MSLATQIAGAIELAQFHQLNDLSCDLWKAYGAGHLDDTEAQALAEQIEARRPSPHCPRGAGASAKNHAINFVSRPKPQRSPDKQASIERRRRLARQSPVPPKLVDKFTQGEHAALTVVCGEIQRCGLCAWCLAKIAAIAGVGKTTVKNAMRKARALGLLHTKERRRRGQKSLTNIVRVLRKSWGAWLRHIGGKKFASTTDKDRKYDAGRPGGRYGDNFGARAGAS
jgi:hypothetical protein